MFDRVWYDNVCTEDVAARVASAELSSEVEEPRRAQSEVGPLQWRTERDTLERNAGSDLLIESPPAVALEMGSCYIW